MNNILLHNNHRNVSPTHVAIFRVLRKMLSTYILNFIKILIKLPGDDSQEGVETYRGASVLTVKTLYCNIVH